MIKILTGLVLGIGTAAIAQDYRIVPPPKDFIFMIVQVTDRGKIENERFFLGPLPKIGQAVEMVYVGDNEEGGMKMQLRAKP